MNDQRINDMPWLVSRKQVVQVFGLTTRELDKHVRAGLLDRYFPPANSGPIGTKSRKGKFYKTQIVALLKCNGK
jgi:hypothetical protein